MKLGKILLAGLTIFAVSMIARADNLAPNLGFEDGNAGWVLFVPPAYQGVRPEWMPTSAESHSGTASAELKSSGQERWGIGFAKRVPVKPGGKYRVSAWVKFAQGAQLSPPAPAAYLRVALYTADNQDAGGRLGHIHVGLGGVAVRSSALARLAVGELPTGWSKLEQIIEIPPDTELISCNVFVQGVAGSVFVDDFAFESVSDDTPAANVGE